MADSTISTLRAAECRVPAAHSGGNNREPGGSNVGGDAGDVLRLALFNWPKQPGFAEPRKRTMLVAPEFSHHFQLRDAVDVYQDAGLIHEGGAEFLRWLVSIRRAG